MIGLPPVAGYADVSRSGLGNSLFPWARCLLWCRHHGVPMIAPIWFRVRIGPYLRRESDKRAYHRLFLTRGTAGLGRAAVLAMRRRLEEPASWRDPPSGSGLVRFGGMGRLFEPLRGEAGAVGAALRDMTRPRLLPSPRAVRPLAVHVRRGDFSTPSSATVLRNGHENYRIPIEWYVEALRAMRAGLGHDLPALVFSDGSEEELAPLLAEAAIERAPPASAITDLLAMSCATALIASGSTFSMWASFLGQIPTLWHPGQRRQFVIGTADRADLEPEWEAGPLPRDFWANTSQAPGR